jgi:prepilin-type N-terminal cleavage/methylation domain-containing protein
MLKRYYNRAIIFGRGDSMRKIDKGFSLVELLIVVIIIGILAGILYLVVGPSDDMVREKACGGNRATVLLALDSYRFSSGVSKETYTLQNFIDDDYKDTISNKEVKCPSGGIYSAGTSNGREAVVCSVHGGGDAPGGGDGPGGDGPGPAANIIPGTDTFGNPGIPPNSTWPTPVYDAYGTTVTNKVTLPKGTTFSYVNASGETDYYVVVNDSGILFGRNQDAVIPESRGINTWGAWELIKFSSREVVSWDDVIMGDIFYSGDIVYYDGNYYVCRAESFTVNKNQWNNNHPESSAGKWAWVKLQ